MKYSRAAILAWLVCGILIVCTVYGTITSFDGASAPQDLLQLISFLGFALLPVVSAIVGALIVSNQPHNVIGWLVMVPAMSTILDSAIAAVLSSVQTAPATPGFELLLAVWGSNASWLLFIFPLLFIVLLFPTGKPPSPRWRPVGWLGIGMILFFLIGSGLSKELRSDPETYGVDLVLTNPIGMIDAEAIGEFFGLGWAIGLMAFTLLSLASLVVRYLRAGAVEREQIKWVFYAAALFGVMYAATLPTRGEIEGPAGDLMSISLSFSALGLPIAIGISILRYRLFDIDVIIRRTLTYALVTALLLAVFFGSVVVLQQVFAGLTGSGRNEIVTVLSTLAIAALFVPVRNWIQTAIDKRFNRKKYDAQRVLADFANTVRDETDLEKLTGRLMQVVDETMQPKSVSVWLRGDSDAKHQTGGSWWRSVQ